MELQGFDTLEATRTLESAGMESAHAGAVVQVVKAGAQGLATQLDIRAVKSDIAALKSDIVLLEARMDAKLGALETRLTNRLYLGFGILFAALMAVRFFP